MNASGNFQNGEGWATRVAYSCALKSAATGSGSLVTCLAVCHGKEAGQANWYDLIDTAQDFKVGNLGCPNHRKLGYINMKIPKHVDKEGGQRQSKVGIVKKPSIQSNFPSRPLMHRIILIRQNEMQFFWDMKLITKSIKCFLDGAKAYEAKCREAGLAFLESLENEVDALMAQEKEAAPADTKQLKEDELMLVEFNIENESTCDLAQTPGETCEKIMEAKMRGLESGTCETLTEPMFRRIDYTTQEKEATPADTKQLKEDELMLVKFNIENESTRDLALTPDYLYDRKHLVWHCISVFPKGQKKEQKLYLAICQSRKPTIASAIDLRKLEKTENQHAMHDSGSCISIQQESLYGFTTN
ncbi:hypothetical protein Tco_1285924 [Tanacetum coccineum]